MSNLQNNKAAAAAAAQTLNSIACTIVDCFCSGWSCVILTLCAIWHNYKMLVSNNNNTEFSLWSTNSCWQCMSIVWCLLVGKRSGMCVARLLYVSFIESITLFISLLSFFLLGIPSSKYDSLNIRLWISIFFIHKNKRLAAAEEAVNVHIHSHCCTTSARKRKTTATATSTDSAQWNW